MSKKFWQWKDSVESNGQELVIDGIISDESWWGDEATPSELRAELSEHSGDLTVSLNSPGGDVFAGVAMYNALRAYDGNVTIRVDGLAASIASVIAMAGDKVIMSPGSMMMIHKPWTLAIGNSEELEKVKDALDKIEDTIVPIYTARTGKSADEIKTLLADETWLTPEDAVAEGFADEATEAKKSGYSDAIKSLFNGQLAYSMSAIKPVMEDMIAKIKAEEVAEEVEDVSTPNEPVEEVAGEATETTDEAESQEEAEGTNEEVVTDDTADESEETEVEEVTETTTEEINESVEEKEMSEIDESVAAEVKAKVEAPKQEVKDETISKLEARKMVVEALAAKYSKDDKAFQEVSNKIETLKVQNVIDGTSGAPLFVEEVLAADIRDQYTIVGRVGNLVNRIDIEGAETFRQLVETAGNGFTPVALGKEKDLDQPVWTSVVFEPFEWALIVAWLDGVQKRSPIAVYNQIVRYIAREYAKLEDKIVLTYAGGTYDGEVRPATGLVPILTTANRYDTVASYESDNVITALGDAYGEVQSDQAITLVANRKTWAQLATSLDTLGRPIFTVVGEQVAAGALGTFNVVLSQVLEDGDVVVGAYADYNLVTRGGLGTLFSREATVGSGEGALNLFTQDASALRADVDITGKPVLNTSFWLLQFPAGS